MSIAAALQRRSDRPDIHKTVYLKQGSRGPEVDALFISIAEMVTDLNENVPGLSLRQLSTLVGVSKTAISKALNQTVAAVEWTTDDNESASAKHYQLLRTCHPDRKYEDDKDNEFGEVNTGTFERFYVPMFRDAPRKADQSHTIKRPITLAGRPFDVAA